MSNKNEENKKAWQTPEIIDLDVNENTKTGNGGTQEDAEWTAS